MEKINFTSNEFNSIFDNIINNKKYSNDRDISKSINKYDFTKKILYFIDYLSNDIKHFIKDDGTIYFKFNSFESTYYISNINNSFLLKDKIEEIDSYILELEKEHNIDFKIFFKINIFNYQILKEKNKLDNNLDKKEIFSKNKNKI